MQRLLGAFHKTGTVLWNTILRAAARECSLNIWQMNDGTIQNAYDLAFDWHSTKIFSLLQASQVDARAVFCIRDPRDVIVSGAYYHKVSDEAWLHVPRKDLGGLTYQQKINSFANMQECFQFELKHLGGNTIRNMLKIPFAAQHVLVTRLERLVEDSELHEFGRIFEFLEFDAQTANQLKAIARSKSLFSGKVSNPRHVRSGKPAQYLSEFSPETLALFEQTFGNAAEVLGYPK